MVTFLRMMSSLVNKKLRLNHGGHRVPQRKPEYREVFLCASVSSVVEVLSRFRQHRRSHVLDEMSGELAGLDLGGAFHQTLEVISHFLLLNGVFHALLDEISGFVPTQVA